MIFKNIITGTFPFVLHYAGRFRSYNDDLITVRTNFSETISFENNCNDFDIVSVKSSNVNKSYIDKQCKDVIFLGEELSKPTYRNNGNITKLMLYLEFLNRTTRKYALLVDSSDTVFCRDVNELVAKYINSDQKIIISAEKRYSYFWKRSKTFEHHAKEISNILTTSNINNTYWGSVNSGCILGKTEDLKKFFKDCLYTYYNIKTQVPKKSDQSLIMYHLYINNLFNTVTIDFDCKYFLTMHNLKENEYAVY